MKYAICSEERNFTHRAQSVNAVIESVTSSCIDKAKSETGGDIDILSISHSTHITPSDSIIVSIIVTYEPAIHK